MAHTETTLNSQIIFSGRIIEVKKDDIQLENGKKSIREVVVHHGGVCVAAIDQEDRLLLVRQFRYPYGKVLLEVPAGKKNRTGRGPARMWDSGIAGGMRLYCRPL